jgi:hypothetical protein
MYPAAKGSQPGLRPPPSSASAAHCQRFDHTYHREPAADPELTGEGQRLLTLPKFSSSGGHRRIDDRKREHCELTCL